MSSQTQAAATAVPRLPRPAWHVARLVAEHRENPATRTLVLDVPGWPGHLPGQHVDVRLTAPDGYQATRSYSIAAPADGDRIELTVQRVSDGEVSPYLVDDLPVGAAVEVLGPVGGWFVRRPDDPAAALLVAGGVGIVPLMAMLRSQPTAPWRLIYSLRSPDLLCYESELAEPDRVLLAYTRRAAADSRRPPGRLTADEVTEHGIAPALPPTCYVCGPTRFVEAMATALTGLGHRASRIKTERFGPSGG